MHTGTIYLLILLNILDLILLNADTYYSINRGLGSMVALYSSMSSLICLYDKIISMYSVFYKEKKLTGKGFPCIIPLYHVYCIMCVAYRKI
jgi:hypothetical protein